MIKRELCEYINKWIELQKKSNEIIKYLFDHTELFEQKYEHEFYDDIFRFFSGKITRCSTDINKLHSYLTQKDLEQLKREEIRRY